MDRNTVIGFVLMGLIFVGFFWINQPSPEQLETRKHYQDSLRMADTEKALKDAQDQARLEEERRFMEESASDSLKLALATNKFGAFGMSASGTEETVILENDLIKVEISNRGGYVSKVILKEYQTYQKEPVVLLDGDESFFNLALITGNNKTINTSEMFFQVKEKTDSSVVMSLSAGEGQSLDYFYFLSSNDYTVKFDIRANNLGNVLLPSKEVGAIWNTRLKQQEKGRKFENRYATLHYKLLGDDVEHLSEGSNERKEIQNGMKWVAFKDQFFSSILIADDEILAGVLNSRMAPDTSAYLKNYTAELTLPFDYTGNTSTGFHFYFGPNQYKILKSYDKKLSNDDQLQLKRLVPLGWGIFRWVNQLLVIPMFNFFGSFISNYGIIILLMTIVIKLILFPLTYKSYLSTAKMRVLRPEIEKINERIPEDKPTERQQAVMMMYKKAGVNPMGGCLPMLLQMPILFAMFSFFPSSIELRGQSFLWAQDLSSYDAIYSWNTYIPVITPYFGNHISLFCLLMTITNLIYTKINMSMTDTGAQQMPGMKYMMYLMPLMFLFFFNDYASGLSYYYLVSTLITIAQTFVMRRFVNEEKLLTTIHENQKKPQKKSGWMQRLEEAQKQQGELQRRQQQQRKK
jgi:YidC/Oxa1 family membrane protein insertase